MTDSSLDFRKQISSSLVAGITALAYIEDDSINLTFPELLVGEDCGQILSMPDDFESFSKLIAADHLLYRELFRRVTHKIVGADWINGPPFQRMIREHHYWRWFELTVLFKFARNEVADSISIDDLYPLSQHFTKMSNKNNGTIIRSTISFRTWDDNTVSELEESFERFNAIINRHWTRTTKNWDREIGARFSPKALTKAAISRRVPRPGEHDPRHFSRLYDSALAVFPSIPGDWPLSAIAEFGVLLLVNYAMAEEPTANSTLELAQELQPIIKTALSSGSIGLRPKFSPRLAEMVEAKRRLGLMTWGRYFQESLALLEARLHQHTYVSIVPTQLFLKERSRFWDRTCRFLSGVLVTTEVTIYRLRVADDHAPLELRGSFCEGERGREKSEWKAAFMRDAAFDPAQRRRSASYRAADKNRTQAAPDRDRALMPPTQEWEWGHSVLAVPIINNGSVWGVLEFVAERPNQFGALLAPQCEAAASLISSNLMIGSMFEALNKLDSYALQPPSVSSEGKDQVRRSELCCALADVFNASLLKLFVATKDDEGRHFKVLEYGEWSASPSNLLETDVLDEVRTFLDDDYVQSREVGEATDRSSATGATRTFLIRLGAEASNAWAGALWIAVPDTVDVDGVWTRNQFALAKVLAPSIANITSAHSWGPSSRRQIRHENERVFNTLEGIRAGLRTEVLSKSRKEVERALSNVPERGRAEVADALRDLWRALENASVDLKAGVDSMQLIIRSLSFDIYDPLLVHPDARIIGIQQSKEQYLKKSLIEVDLRDAVISALQTAIRNASDRHLSVVVPASAPRRTLRMDPRAISAVLGTLAENAAKYSQNGSQVLVAFRDLNDGAIRLIISNLAPPLSPSELETVFEYGVRGETAMRSHPSQGSGLGLGFAKATMELWDGFLDYTIEAMNSEKKGEAENLQSKELVWHRLILTFPRALVVV